MNEFIGELKSTTGKTTQIVDSVYIENPPAPVTRAGGWPLNVHLSAKSKRVLPELHVFS